MRTLLFLASSILLITSCEKDEPSLSQRFNNTYVVQSYDSIRVDTTINLLQPQSSLSYYFNYCTVSATSCTYNINYYNSGVSVFSYSTYRFLEDGMLVELFISDVPIVFYIEEINDQKCVLSSKNPIFEKRMVLVR